MQAFHSCRERKRERKRARTQSERLREREREREWGRRDSVARIAQRFFISMGGYVCVDCLNAKLKTS